MATKITEQEAAVEQDEDEFDPQDGTKEIMNISQGKVVFILDGVRHVMKAGDVRRVKAAYASKRQMQKGAPELPSVVELETGRKVLPVDDPRAAPQYKALVSKVQKSA